MDRDAIDVAEKLWDAEEAGEYLGFCERKVRKMASQGMLPAIPFKTGSRTFWRFRKSDLIAHTQSMVAAQGVGTGNGTGLVSSR